MKGFFRGNPSGFQLDIFGEIHLISLLIALLGVVYLVKNIDRIKSNNRFNKLLIIVLFLQQTILYTWYGRSGYFTIRESLPLYNCRLAILCLIIGEVFKRERLKNIGMYWGFMGSILALLVPVLDPFGTDHYTFYSFFIGHLFLLWGSLYLILVRDRQVDKNSFKDIFIFTNLYHLAIFVFNVKTGANYCYMSESPVAIDFISQLPPVVYTCLAIVVFDILIFFTHMAIKNILKKKNTFINEVDINIIVE